MEDSNTRELTSEEASRDITWERFRAFHYASGEDFLDYTGEGNLHIFGGWLLHKYPDYSSEILKVCNKKFGGIPDFRELPPLGYDECKDVDSLYEDFAEFCNQTEALKKRVNKVLILTSEYYGENL